VDIRIDALRLRAAGIEENSAQRLAGLIARRLSTVLPASAEPGNFGRLDVTLQARTGDSLDDLAEGAAAAVLRAISASGTSAVTPERGTSA
jgi:hypothetical protein